MQRINQWLRGRATGWVYGLGLLPVPWLLYMAQTGGLGREPIKALEHELGELALKLLILGLAVTPVRKHLNLNLLKFRRAFGLLAFIYVTLHLLVWLVLDVGNANQIWEDIVKRPYITIGMVAFVAMVPLALTSSNYAIKRMGVTWRKLHRLTYAVVFLGGVHFVMVKKGFQVEPLVYLCTILGLLLLRKMGQRPGRVPSS